MNSSSMRGVVQAGTWGALLGGAVGFALGLLVAPEEGQKVRRRLAYQLEHLAEGVAGLVDTLLTPQRGSDARRTGDALVADAQDQARRIRDDIDALLGEMRRQDSPR